MVAVTCSNRATGQFVFSGEDGLNHISVPLCENCSDEEQPAETFAVFEIFGRHQCDGLDDPPWLRCLCHGAAP